MSFLFENYHNSMTLTLKLDLDIVNMYLYNNIEVPNYSSSMLQHKQTDRQTDPIKISKTYSLSYTLKIFSTMMVENNLTGDFSAFSRISVYILRSGFCPRKEET